MAAQDVAPWNPPVKGLLHGTADASQRGRKRRLDILEISQPIVVLFLEKERP
jgi:hypothetical protein